MQIGPLGPEAVVKQAYLIARRMVEHEAARDIAQDTWIKYRSQLLKEGPDWAERPARAWIRCVAGNAARSLLRRTRPQALEPDQLQTRGGEDDPARQVERAEEHDVRRELARRVLCELPRPKRDLLTLRDMEDRSWKDIAKILDENPRTLRSRYSRLKAELRQRVQRERERNERGDHRTIHAEGDHA